MVQFQDSKLVEDFEALLVPAVFVPWARVLLQHASPKPSERVLDVACGTGAVTRQVAPLIAPTGRLAALDLSAAMLEKARAIPAPDGAAIEWTEGDAGSLPWPDGSFDLVLCQQGIQFFPDRSKAAQEMRRVLVTGGRVAAAVWASLDRQPATRELIGAVAEHFGLPPDQIAKPYALGDETEFRRLFVDAGFKEVKVVTRSLDSTFLSAARYVRMRVTRSAATTPGFADLGQDAGQKAIDSIYASAMKRLEPYIKGESITFPNLSIIAVAWR